MTVLEGDKENPLLDSKFPDVSGKGRGYQIQTYDSGQRDWPEIRKVSIWQAAAALEAEFHERVAAAASRASQEKGTAPRSLTDGGGSRGSSDSEDLDGLEDRRHVRKKLFSS